MSSTGWLYLALASLVLFLIYRMLASDTKKIPAKKPLHQDKQQPHTWEASTEIRPDIHEYKELPTDYQELPTDYQENQMVIMVKDPYWLYAYWEISPEKWAELSTAFKSEVLESGESVLRIYDITGLEFDGNYAHTYYDIVIHPMANNWFINVPKPNRTYCVDLGRLLPGGNFITLLRSNGAEVPRISYSEEIDEAWPPIQGIYTMLGKYDHQETLSSRELVKQ